MNMWIVAGDMQTMSLQICNTNITDPVENIVEAW